jgi:superfamily II DNA/RNA helicase
MGLPQELLGILMENGFPYPSKVQAHAIKLILENQEDHIIVQAPTGSGKTVAFILSTLTRIDRADPNAQVMLVAPTNELLVQLANEYKSFAEPLNITVTHVKKGDKTFPGQVLLMTPAQCTGLFKLKGESKPVLDHVKFLILDEADHLLNIEDQPEFFNHMETIIKECLPPASRCLLFSATYSDPVMAKIEEVLERGYTEVMVKKEDLILENIKMFYIHKTEDQGKVDLLVKILRESVSGITIVFSKL